MMKNWMWVIGVMASTIALAGGIGEEAKEERMAVIPKGENVFGVIYKSAEKTTVKVSIYDADDQLVFEEKLNSRKGFLRPYNFSGLDYGKYTIQVEDENGIRLQTVNYQRKLDEKIVNIVKLSESKKYLFTAAGEGEERIMLNIYDNADNLLYNEFKTIAGDFGQLYNLNEIKGGCTFEIIHQNGTVKRLQYP